MRGFYVIILFFFCFINGFSQNKGPLIQTPSAGEYKGSLSLTVTSTDVILSSSVTDTLDDWQTLISDVTSVTSLELSTVSFGNRAINGNPTLFYDPNSSISSVTIDENINIIFSNSSTSLSSNYNLKNSYWVLIWNGGYYKRVKIEFQETNNELQVKYSNSSYRSDSGFSLNSFDSSTWTNGVYELDLISVKYSNGSQSTSNSVNLKTSNIVVGLPYLGINQSPYKKDTPSDYIENTLFDIGFPWGTLYLSKTFQEDGFTISKGYYSDKVLLNWRIYNNLENITGFEIFRTEDLDSDNPTWGTPIQTLSNTERSFTDLSTDGGKLYRYKVKAIGVVTGDPDSLYETYFEGIGFRNPTGLITGNISYEGGNPVKNVTIAAVPDGGFTSSGSSLFIRDNSFIKIPRFHENLMDSLTLQTWIKPTFSNTSTNTLSLFSLKGNSSNTEITFGVVSSTKIVLNVSNFKFELEGYYPNGQINNKGEDIMIPIESFISRFNHLSFVLNGLNNPEIYINGRLINSNYVVTINNYVKELGINNVTTTLSETISGTFDFSKDDEGNPENFSSLNIGGGNDSYFDEIRIFNSSLTNDIILRDYKRYLKGDEPNLHTYLRLDERSGEYAYDLSRNGFNFHSNNATLKPESLQIDDDLVSTSFASWSSSSDQIPASDQLGVLGVSDSNGNYVISAVPYTGSGQTYLITPSLGKHQFSPSQEILFIGIGSEVVNNVDFIDNSSFVFKGRVLFDSRNIFPEGPDSDDVIGDIRDGEFYNAYTVGNQKYPKGEYWAQYGTGTESNTIVRLNRYAPIPVEDALIYIDDQLVIGSGNNPVTTDNNGRFQIEVPIGQHQIKVKKQGHVFEFEGRFPKIDTIIELGEEKIKNTLFDFFEDQDEEVVFLDNTTISVIGRVVGGSFESNKPLGFGFDGKKSYQENTTVPEEVYTSNNNIGTASITLGYRQPGVTSITPEYKTTFSTNQDTGEFRVNLLPLRYELNQRDLVIGSQTGSVQRFLDANKILNYSEITVEEKNYFIKENVKIDSTLPYNYEAKFIYRSNPQITILEQTSDKEIVIETSDGETTYTVSNTNFNLYSQGVTYSIKVQKQEQYINYEKNSDEQLRFDPVTDGELIITNNLSDSRAGSEYIIENENDKSKLTYYFKAGLPNTDTGSSYLANISLLYRLNGNDYPISGYQNQGVILGSKSSGGTTFETAGPEIPDIILRDPPGTESTATINKGSTFSVTRKNAGGIGTSIKASVQAKLGLKVGVGGGILGPLIESESYIAATTGIGIGFSSEFGNELTTNYTFNQTISTSDDPDWVGSDADLYIGTSYNQFYGVMDDIKVTTSQISDTSIELGTTSGTLYVSKSKALYFSPGEEKTVFIYSQREILTEIIPYYKKIYENYECISLNNDDDSTNNVDSCPIDIEGDLKPKVWYDSQMKLWKRVIQKNEEIKYMANSDKQGLKNRIDRGIIDNFSDKSSSDSNLLNPGGSSLKQLFDQNFYENISFDSGLGEFTKSVSSGKTNIDEYSFTFELEQTNELEVVLEYSGSGGTIKLENENTASYTNSGNKQVENTLEVSYKLRDVDDYNKLSVDVVNAFDGNGPVFVTKGGETSCPVEGPSYSYFFNPTIQPVSEDSNESILELQNENKVELSKGTVAIEVPFISVENSSLVGVPESRAAEFKIQLRNNSVLNPEESDFILYVDQTTNPNNAIINLDDTGTPFYLNEGKTVDFTVTLEKGSNDVYNYEDIRIVFESMCDDDLSEEIFISASFIESCSKVEVLSPLEDWVINQTNGLNTIGEGIPLTIEIESLDYNTDSFERIDLEYRSEGSPTWTNLKTYVTSLTILNDLVANGETNVTSITNTLSKFDWDISGSGLADGNYEIRARSTCLNGKEYYSPVVKGKVDLTPPVIFGTPKPTNGILSIGDDILARFSEPIKSNGTLTRYEFKIQKNQLPVKHEVSLEFSGDNHVGEIQNPYIESGDISIEFWLKNLVGSSSAKLITQENGINVEVSEGSMTFQIGDQSISASLSDDDQYHHYALTYDFKTGETKIIQNDLILKNEITQEKLQFSSNSSIYIGGENFRGNLHDLRLWRKNLSREDAVAYMNEILNGNEENLLGYWPMNEGNGNLAKDLSRFKHIDLKNINWSIFPKTTSYKFNGSNYLSLDKANKSVITPQQDLTISFWFKTVGVGPSTIISNGKGDDSDSVGSNGYSNKWSIGLDTNNQLSFKTENENYTFGNKTVNDNLWHHASIVVKRFGNMILYLDGQNVASYSNEKIGGFSGSKLFIGARGQIQQDGTINFDQYYQGNIEEFRLWSLAKTAPQIQEDMFYEADNESLGLLLYSPFNSPSVSNSNGPIYWYPYTSFEMRSDYANLNNQSLSFDTVSPPVKPKRPIERLVVQGVINYDEILITPQITDWASVENKLGYITIANLYDLSDNRQLSPVTWSALINKNPLKWYIEGQGNTVEYTSFQGENFNFQINIQNRSNTSQPYSILFPDWLDILDSSGNVPPNTTITVDATIKKDISSGLYEDNLKLISDYNFNENINLKARVLTPEPDWDFNPSNFDGSMTIIGKISVNGKFSSDEYDKIVAKFGDETRGLSKLEYKSNYDDYFVLLTVYGNPGQSENIDFYLWDSSSGRIKNVSIDDQPNQLFVSNSLLGNFQTPIIFKTTNNETQYFTLNKGWTWLSFNVEDNDFNNLDELFKSLSLDTSDQIKSISEFDNYDINQASPTLSGWDGSISNNGGLSSSKMYKVRLGKAQNLNIDGQKVDLENWSFNIENGWNWLPYVIPKNTTINEALSNYNPSSGDIIKSQTQFAIYDGNLNIWEGNLLYMFEGQGYMIYSQNGNSNFSYPAYLGLTSKQSSINELTKIKPEQIDPLFAVHPFTMNLIGKVLGEYDTILFKNGKGQLVGSSPVISKNGIKMIYSTIYGMLNEQINMFGVKRNKIFQLDNQIDFINNGLIGNLSNPYIIGDYEQIEKTLQIYPNPFDREIYVKFESKSNIRRAIIKVFDMSNKLYLTKDIKIEAGQNEYLLNPQIEIQGTYVVQVLIENKVFSSIVIKR